jgi:hypothetical protein
MRTATKVPRLDAKVPRLDVWRACRSCVGSRGEVRGHRDRRWIGITNSVAKGPLLPALALVPRV